MKLSTTVSCENIQEPSKVIPAVTPIVSKSSSTFGDDVWDITSIDYHEAREIAHGKIDFSDISPGNPALKNSAKELAYHRLNTSLSNNRRPIGVYTCHKEQVRLKRFYRWLAHFYPEIHSLPDISQPVIHAYRIWLSNPENTRSLPSVKSGRSSTEGTISSAAIWSYLSPIASFDAYRDYLSSPMSFRPYAGKLSGSFLGFMHLKGENTTEAISDEILHALLTYSLKYIEIYSADIMEWIIQAEALRTLLLESNLRRKTLRWDRAVMPVSNCPDLKGPWRNPFDMKAPHHDFRREISNLIAACLVIVLYLSGMRPGEVSMLKIGCLREERDTVTGKPFRWKIFGIPEKKRKISTQHVFWVVPEIVGKTIKLLEEFLQPFRHKTKSDFLFLNLDAFVLGVKPDDRGYPLTTRSIAVALETFLETISERYYPLKNKALKPSQFRRTLARHIARHIARQPLGIIAGKLQYHHTSTIIFQGYCGSADSGFRLEKQEEELIAKIDLLEELEEDCTKGVISIPGSVRVAREYMDLKTELVKAKQDISPANLALKASIKSLANNLYVGPLNYCSFDVSKALCLSEKKDINKPNIAMCSPTKCANSVVSRCHLPKWQALFDEATILKKESKTSLQRQSLDTQIQEYKKVLNSVKDKE